MASSDYEMLLSPFRIGNVVLKNRIVMPAIVTNYASKDGFVTDHMLDYYGERARNGVGLIIVEGTTIKPGGEIVAHNLAFHDDRYIKGLRELASTIKGYGVPAIIQFLQAGARAISDVTGLEQVAPSDVVIRFDVPRAMTVDDIRDHVRLYAEGAVRAREAGFDGVEVHVAHLYLLSQFVSRFTNKRTDDYGGSIENRARFPLEIVREIRARTGKDFLIFARIDGFEQVQEGVDIEEAKLVAQLLEREGVDAVNVTAVDRLTEHDYLGLRTIRFVYSVLPKGSPEGAIVKYAAEVKKTVGVPVLTVGKIFDPHLAESILQEGKADLICMARSLIADPEVPRKIREGRVDEIRKCVECTACTFTVGVKHWPMRCGSNLDLKKKYSLSGPSVPIV